MCYMRTMVQNNGAVSCVWFGFFSVCSLYKDLLDLCDHLWQGFWCFPYATVVVISIPDPFMVGNRSNPASVNVYNGI